MSSKCICVSAYVCGCIKEPQVLFFIENSGAEEGEGEGAGVGAGAGVGEGAGEGAGSRSVAGAGERVASVNNLFPTYESVQ